MDTAPLIFMFHQTLNPSSALLRAWISLTPKISTSGEEAAQGLGVTTELDGQSQLPSLAQATLPFPQLSTDITRSMHAGHCMPGSLLLWQPGNGP